MPVRMTSAAWRRGSKNALICLVRVVAFLGVLAFAISAIFQQTIRDSFGMAFCIFWILIFAVIVFSWLYGKNGSGSVLLECGPHPTRSLFLINAVLFLLMGAGGSFTFFANNFDKFGIAGALFGVTFSIYWVIMASGRLQIREHGIWQYWSLLKWQKIKSYQWEGETDSTLMLQAKTKLPFLGRGALPVPIEHKDAIDELIKQYRAVDT